MAGELENRAREYRFQIKGPSGEQLYIVPQGASFIGRQAGSHLMLDDPQVSRKHAQIDCTPQECRLTDLGSSNGTIFRGERLTAQAPVILEAGDAIKIGPFEISVLAIPVIPPVAAQPPAARAPGEQAPPSPARQTPPDRQKAPAPPAGPPPVRQRAPAPPVGAPPAAPPPQAPAWSQAEPPPGDELFPAGLSIYSRKLMNFMPGIYHTDFMARFLGIFEAILSPIEWNIDNFDLYLDPSTAPQGFLPWLENWFALPPGPNWSQAQRRKFLDEAHLLYARRGTRWALSRILEIYTGVEPQIVDDDKSLDPHTFRVTIPLRQREVNSELVEAIIDANKPAHTTYTLEFKR
ncbi:MAG: FHA domain-containing protein [Anaerolineales bacterium]|nr:FHA domain-containing protein [Anaerolineales bacterium]